MAVAGNNLLQKGQQQWGRAKKCNQQKLWEQMQQCGRQWKELWDTSEKTITKNQQHRGRKVGNQKTAISRSGISTRHSAGGDGQYQ